MKKITQDNIKEMLGKWAQGLLTAEEMHEWAGQYYQNDAYEFVDWEGADENSVTNEVLAHLDMLDMNLVTHEDIPQYLAFLASPAGGFDEGLSILERYLNSVDMDTRKKQLKGIVPYKPFCA